MKEETEIKWAVNLLDSEKSLSKQGGKISEYENFCQAPTNSKEFRLWFKKMVKEEIITFMKYQESSMGGIPTKIYKLGRMKLINYLNNFDLYKKAYNVILEDYFAIKRS
jgi:hypothetical protein